MNARDRRALFAFFVVASVCALLLGQGTPPIDGLIGRSATPSAGATVTLTPQPDSRSRSSRAGQPDGPAQDPAADPGSSSGDRNSPGSSDSAIHGNSGGLPPQANGGRSGSAGKPHHASGPVRGNHRPRARSGDGDRDTDGKKETGKKRNKGGKGKDKGAGQLPDKVPDHAPAGKENAPGKGRADG